MSDVAGVVVFVAIGRNNHDEGTALSGVLKVAAPFLIALAVGWLVASRVDRRPSSVRFGVVVWAVTLVLGMVLRRTLFDKGTAVAFVIVATLFLALVLLGWRAVEQVRERRRL